MISRVTFLLVASLVSVGSAAHVAADVLEPLPYEVAAAVRVHSSRTALGLSRDGRWLVDTYAISDVMTRETDRDLYSPTGVSFAEGSKVLHTQVVDTVTGESIELGSPKQGSWDGVWSPDGEEVAFYSDERSTAGLWVWNKRTRQERRFPGVVVHPFFAFEAARWAMDGYRLLCPILPEGLTDATNQGGQSPTDNGARGSGSGPTVRILKSDRSIVDSSTSGAEPEARSPRTILWADLAVLDWRTQTVTRVARHVRPRWFEFSADQKYIAYTTFDGNLRDSQQATYSIHLYEIKTGRERLLTKGLRLNYGVELSWSPDGRYIAYIESGQLGSGAMTILAVATGKPILLGGVPQPSFDIDHGKRAPLWDAASGVVYAVAKDGRLWKGLRRSGVLRVVASITDHRIVGLVSRAGGQTLWTAPDRRSAWVIVQDNVTNRMGLSRVDLQSGISEVAFEREGTVATVFNTDANDATGRIIYIASDQTHLPDAWSLDAKSAEVHQVTHLNSDMDRFELGRARLIEYHSQDARILHGALLLPPRYRAGQRVPLLVWVYGGSYGSASVNAFGLWSWEPTFNFQILATRGYGVLFPDAPVSVGSPIDSLLATVMPGVQAAVDQGYADPERLAISGQSYGSYCTLALITRTRRFKAAIISASGIHPDLVSAYLLTSVDGTDSMTGYFEHGQGNMGGTPWEYRERYLDNSPVYNFDQIQTPLLIGQGALDGDLSASNATFAAMRRLGKSVDYLIYAGESHVISRTANVVDFWQRRVAFLDEHLGVDERAATTAARSLTHY